MNIQYSTIKNVTYCTSHYKSYVDTSFFEGNTYIVLKLDGFRGHSREERIFKKAFNFTTQGKNVLVCVLKMLSPSNPTIVLDLRYAI